MISSRTPWIAKLHPDQEPKVVSDPRGGGRMLVPTPLLVAAEVRRIRKGRLRTPSQLRQRLAARYGADVTCPMTTGIFLAIIAGAAEEQAAAGKRPVAPYWRVVGDDGSLNPKWPTGPARQANRLRSEGHSVRRVKGIWRLCGPSRRRP